MPALGLWKRKEILLPTLRGWLLLAALAGGLAFGMVVGVVPFLSVMRPIGQGVLVVEGWLPDYALEEAKKTFESRPYRILVVTGVPIDHGFHISVEKDYAQLAAATLRHLGVKPESIIPVSCPEVARNRTYATASQVRTWLHTRSDPGPVDVFTLGVHARRSWLLYDKALGRTYRTGVVAGQDRRFDGTQWWKTSSGFRTVINEVIAYLYARLVFRPGKEAPVRVNRTRPD